jgi:hypothetical protein
VVVVARRWLLHILISLVVQRCAVAEPASPSAWPVVVMHLRCADGPRPVNNLNMLLYLGLNFRLIDVSKDANIYL